jgi:hypothetical protein
MKTDVRADKRFNNDKSMSVISTIFLLSLFILCSCQPVGTSVTSMSSASTTPVTIPPAGPPGNTTSEAVVQQNGESGKWVADGIISPGEYQQTNTYGDINISWSNDSQYICIGLNAKTAGWVAIGFGSESLMKNMDIVEGVVKDGKAEVYDMFSTGDFGPHPADTELGGTDNIIESAVKSANSITVLEFKRKLDTGDKFDKPLVKGPNKVSWSCSTDTLVSLKHVNRGYGEIVIK